MNFGMTCSPVLGDEQRALAAHTQCEISTETWPKFFPRFIEIADPPVGRLVK
jgi:hypothetical protein